MKKIALILLLLVVAAACRSVPDTEQSPTASPASSLPVGQTEVVPQITSTSPPTEPSAGDGSNQGAQSGLKLLITFSEENRPLYIQVARPGDRLLFLRQNVLNPTFWPSQAQNLPAGDVVITWPSWKDAQQQEALWAPYTTVFGYDIENDSPDDEIQDVVQTITDLKAYLTQLSAKYGHPFILSCGLNYQFGSMHGDELAFCDEVHIHANELLRTYPAKGLKDRDYVDWALNRAIKVRQINPNVAIWFAAVVHEMDPAMAIPVAEAILQKMQAQGLAFEGFTTFGELAEIQAFVDWMR